MKILYASDLHGRMPFYESLTHLVHENKPDFLILGGDLLPRAGSPQATLTTQSQFCQTVLPGWIEKLTCPVLAIPGNDDLLHPIHRLAGSPLDAGLWDRESTPQAARSVDSAGSGLKRATANKKISQAHNSAQIQDSPIRGLPLAGRIEEQSSSGVENSYGRQRNPVGGKFNWLELKGIRLDTDFIVTGYPFVPPTPFSAKDFEKPDYPGQTLRHQPFRPFITQNGRIEDIDIVRYLKQRSSIQDDLENSAQDNSKLIFVSHCPPYDTDLDRLRDGTPVGSRSIRAFIESRKPVFSLHGHIHESPEVTGRFWTKLNGTISINAGQNTNQLAAVLLTLQENRLLMDHTLYGLSEIEREQAPETSL